MSDEDVTLCPTCGGSEPDCDEPGFIWDGIAHVLDGSEFIDEDDDEVILESGPDTMGLELVEGGAASQEGTPDSGGVVAYDLRENLVWPDDPIGVVCVGDDNGLAHIATRALGGTEGPFTEDMAAMVNDFRHAAGLTEYPEGTIVGKVWAMVLPPLTIGSHGPFVNILCKVLGVPSQKILDEALMAEAVSDSSEINDLANYEFDMADWIAVL